MGKAIIINPYLDTMGGGERYTLSFAKVLSEFGYQVDFEWKDDLIKKSLEKRFGLDLKFLNFVKDGKKGDGYDLCFWVSDGSIPLLRARKNMIHFQVPFTDVDGKSIVNKMKLFRVSSIISNSNFTKQVIDSEFGVNSVVVYPPIDIQKIKPKRKENIILYVGRFSKLMQNKKQEILIEMFNKLDLKDWKLILAGGVEVGADEYVNELKTQSNNTNIEIIESPDFSTLKDLYGKSKIFWSASGFGVDEDKNPQLVEHFGMSLVEAMSAGLVPVVFDAGGHKEIVDDGLDGFLWRNADDLLLKTKNLIEDKSSWREMSKNAISKSHKFSYEEFRDSIKKIL